MHNARRMRRNTLPIYGLRAVNRQTPIVIPAKEVVKKLNLVKTTTTASKQLDPGIRQSDGKEYGKSIASPDFVIPAKAGTQLLPACGALITDCGAGTINCQICFYRPIT